MSTWEINVYIWDDYLIAEKEMKEMKHEIQDQGDELGANEPLWI